MKLIKIYLIVVTVLLVLALGFGVYVWYVLQTMDADIEAGGAQMRETTSEITKESDASVPESTSSTVTPSTPATKPVVIDTTTLPESQQKVLTTFGFDEGTLTITPEMVSCAESKVGVLRTKEIAGGSTPTALETAKLLPCLTP